MLGEPSIVERPAQVYAGRRESIVMTEFARVADHLPGMFGWLGERGVTPVGAPFFRYRVIEMAAELVVEAGIPLAAPIEVAEPVFVDEVPAGRYVTLTHIGHPDELVGVTAGLLDWARERDLIWDMTPTPTGEVWTARLEVLMTNPAEQPDMHQWETVLLFKLAD
ncbi:GyrI-like domain-containing protein [Symbioplanes lichenis]|uniref:GyrI-like domain-containing protein n=1 Tax=Symbioplanes lichenis TaxID=1629072 RepID=UPI00273932B2|nr:GyrI-like domain-containing protein [Actinoplanes lichenis]